MLTKSSSDYDWASNMADAKELTVTITLAEYRSLIRRAVEKDYLIAELREQVRELGGSPAAAWREAEGEVV